MKSRVLVLSADPYRMTDEKTGEIINQGTTMFYYSNPDLTKVENSETSIGCKPCKENMPYEWFEVAKAHGLPALAEVDFVLRVSQGKQILKIASIELLDTDLSFVKK